MCTDGLVYWIPDSVRALNLIFRSERFSTGCSRWGSKRPRRSRPHHRSVPVIEDERAGRSVVGGFRRDARIAQEFTHEAAAFQNLPATHTMNHSFWTRVPKHALSQLAEDRSLRS
jgi:hypothetical protein